jgi:hypothetical protein
MDKSEAKLPQAIQSVLGEKRTDNEERAPRTPQEMEQEALMLRGFLEPADKEC